MFAQSIGPTTAVLKDKLPMDAVETVASLQAKIQEMSRLVRQNEAKQKSLTYLSAS